MRLANLNNICSPCTFFSAPGDDVKILYRGVRSSPDKPLVLVPDGKISISEYINSFGASTDMAYILSRLRAGDSSVLFCNQSSFGDTTIFPPNPAEALQFVNNATAYFDQLPSDVRSRFDDSFAVWIKSAGTPDWIKKMVVSSSDAGSGDSAGSDAAAVSSDVRV